VQPRSKKRETFIFLNRLTTNGESEKEKGHIVNRGFKLKEEARLFQERASRLDHRLLLERGTVPMPCPGQPHIFKGQDASSSRRENGAPGHRVERISSNRTLSKKQILRAVPTGRVGARRTGEGEISKDLVAVRKTGCSKT